jgi:hypothetical protein
MLLNLGNRVLNYHGAINSLMLWDFQTPQRVVQMLNRIGFSQSPSYQARAVAALSRSALIRSCERIRDPSAILQVGYDNLNWYKRAWEASSTHGSKQHDMVSAILYCVQLPAGIQSPTLDIMSIAHFMETENTRHTVLPRHSLRDISPSKEDACIFCKHAAIHIGQILCDTVSGFKQYTSALSAFLDPLEAICVSWRRS